MWNYRVFFLLLLPSSTLKMCVILKMDGQIDKIDNHMQFRALCFHFAMRSLRTGYYGVAVLYPT